MCFAATQIADHTDGSSDAARRGHLRPRDFNRPLEPVKAACEVQHRSVTFLLHPRDDPRHAPLDARVPGGRRSSSAFTVRV